ncbi:helix-turn-helix transcriptional regulator [Methylobacterium marchantiae]|uniref:LuxR C-terminal-related transcriptional regulator n=1 Tax=Methylobacterium marchantiae TaxID=600331 RepID=A0ABW3WY13_9HYPH
MVLVVPNEVFREGLKSVLSGSRIKVGLCFDSVTEFQSSRDSPRDEAIVLIDCATEAEVASISELAAQFQSETSSIRIVVLAGPEATGLWPLANLGIINAFVPRSISTSALVNLLYLVWDGFVVTQMGVVQAMKHQQRPEPLQIECPQPARTDDAGLLNDMRSLSNREREILLLLTNGASNKEIARKLNIAEATVKIHVKGVFRKIGAVNRTQAAIWALMRAETEQPIPLPLSATLDVGIMINGAA